MDQLVDSPSRFYSCTGWPDRRPVYVYGAYTDFLNPRFGAAAIIAALDYKRRTGRGQYLDQYQFETGSQFMAPVLMDYMVNGRVSSLSGNRLPYAAPHGVYPCKGGDRWVAIAVFTDSEWEAFSGVIGSPVWASDPKFATLAARKENEDELDLLVAEWTKDFVAEEATALMQAAGLVSGVVESTRDLFEDPQLRHRDHFRTFTHGVIGETEWDGPSFKLSKTPDSQFAPPYLGQHNEYVYKEILGLTDDDIADFLVEGVIDTVYDAPVALRPKD